MIFGGVSSEHDISCLSAASILRNLDREKYEIYPVGITQDGRWYYCPDCTADTVENGEWERLTGKVPALFPPDRSVHGLVLLRGGSVQEMEQTINNLAGSITGMICDGGNQGCVMKGVVAVDAAYRSVNMAMNGIHVDRVHGINGDTPEETMKNMGLIASPGMVGTEKTIVEILQNKGA